MEPKTMIQAATGVFVRRVNDEMVVLDSNTEMYLELNPSAAVMWEIGTTLSDRSSALEALADRFPDADPDRLAADFDRLVSELLDRGLAVDG